MNEFCIEWVKGSEHASITTPSGTALKSKLMKLSQERPEEVKMIAENNDGSAMFHVPVSYVKVSPPRKVSDKQREAMGERARKMWEERKGE